MKRKSRKLGRKRHSKRTKKQRRIRTKSTRKHSRRKRSSRTSRRRHSVKLRAAVRRSPVDRRVLGVLADMRSGESLARSIRKWHIKRNTFLRLAGNTVYRSGLGKPWKARKSDRLSALMTIITEQGPVRDLVRRSAERKLLNDYYVALRSFRAGEDGAVERLRRFDGKSVAGHVLITDPTLLIRLEEAGRLDFDGLYHSPGSE